MKVVTRFAPSPTGYLHIGGARTALFNWLYARHNNGTFLLRIEDTDRERSTQAAVDAILDGMRWLGLDWDGEPYYQFSRANRHAEIAHELVKSGKAFYCYTTPQELEEFRKNNPNAKFRSPWRDTSPPAQTDAPAVVRIKAPLDGQTVVQDKVQGTVTVQNSELDDMVLLRSDGTPTYMLAVVVDDHDMGVTQVIRGDDHLTNTFRQLMIYDAMGWKAPDFAHIPLIHGADGAKLSKRHGAQAVGDYRDMGYLPEAVRNYLLRLGWSHGDEEIISTEQAIAWFGLEAVGKSPSRFDFTKLENLNGHYMREASDERLVELILPKLPQTDATGKSRLLKGMPGLKARAKNINELADAASIYLIHHMPDAKAAEMLSKGKEMLAALVPMLHELHEWDHEKIEQICRQYSESAGQKLGSVAQPLRVAVTGRTVSPGIFEVMEILGKDESLGRISAAC